MTEEIPEVTVVVPISERHDNLENLYHLYSSKLAQIGKTFEFLFIIDGHFPVAQEELQKLKKTGNAIKILKFPRSFGESAALMEGFRSARGAIILTLASYIQVDSEDIPKLFSAYEEGYDLVISRRYPRIDPILNRIQSRLYHYIVNKLTGCAFKDITCGARLIKKNILSEFTLYGDLYRFIPVFAFRKGLKVTEVNVRQKKDDTELRLLRPGAYLRRLLDILTLFFLVKFTRKPLRFFGLIGSTLLVLGAVITSYLGILRLLGQMGLANRPLLLLGIVLMVFGIQLFSVGLVGELILFTHAKELESYRIEEIIE
ncbi:MAG: glycosyltransferase [Candidatus Omnitrophica bacterium]|nr:glycosyltransferase [Candidatus Omnitrophota bacterium]